MKISIASQSPALTTVTRHINDSVYDTVLYQLRKKAGGWIGKNRFVFQCRLIELCKIDKCSLLPLRPYGKEEECDTWLSKCENGANDALNVFFDKNDETETHNVSPWFPQLIY